MRFALAFSIAALSLGCLDTFEPEVGPLVQVPCVNEDSDPDIDVSFIEDIVVGIVLRPESDCVRCHTPSGATPIGLEETGFDISSYASLRAGGANSGSAIVIPGEPCSSILVQKTGPAPPFGERMPLSGPPYLKELDRQLVHDWIAEGARDN